VTWGLSSGRSRALHAAAALRPLVRRLMLSDTLRPPTGLPPNRLTVQDYKPGTIGRKPNPARKIATAAVRHAAAEPADVAMIWLTPS
jgi:hypothetical protein